MLERDASRVTGMSTAQRANARDQAMRMEDADHLFTKNGFWRHIFPQMIVIYLLFGGIGAIVGAGSSPLKAALAVGITCLALTGAQLYAYSRAARQHMSLKQKYGSQYRR